MSKDTNTNTNTSVNNKVTGKRDSAAPKLLKVTITADNGQEWSTMVAVSKEFKTGSVGFYAGDKVTNPESGERYQVGMNFTLIGSKPA